MNRIGNFLVSSETERFRIFPQGKDGTVRPITRINNFLYLRCLRSGQFIAFKRYLHLKQWYWRDSRDTKPTSEREVVSEVARMLFGGDENRARDVLVAVVTGGRIPHGESVA